MFGRRRHGTAAGLVDLSPVSRPGAAKRRAWSIYPQFPAPALRSGGIGRSFGPGSTWPRDRPAAIGFAAPKRRTLCHGFMFIICSCRSWQAPLRSSRSPAPNRRTQPVHISHHLRWRLWRRAFTVSTLGHWFPALISIGTLISIGALARGGAGACLSQDETSS